MKKFLILVQTAVMAFFIISCTGQNSNLSGMTEKPKITEPVKIIKKRIRIDDPSLNAIVITAWENYHLGRYEQSALDFERLYKKGYDHYDILFGAGISFFKYYDLQKSIRYLDLAIEKNPEHFMAIYIKGIYFNNLKKYTEAKKNFSAVLLLDLQNNFTCGYYSKDYADKNDLADLKEEIHMNYMN
ncbi:MAG: hypothetical protein JW982_04770 [Spirochaetes bacterium]|nr:hypothetical protein [Spirochaetota bacterium]